MRAVGYARVSSAAQRERDTIASQLRVLPEFIARHNWTLVVPIETYVDDGRTAKAGHLGARVGLQRLLRDAAAGLFDVVVIVDLDRLTRAEDLAERGLILGALQVAGVRVAQVSGGDVMDLNSDMGDLLASIRASYAAAENRKRSKRVLEGKITAARRGGKSGGITPYGFVFERPSTWRHHPEQVAIVRELAERVAGGESCWALAAELNARGIPWHGPTGRWSRGRVYDLVTSRTIVGEYTANSRTRTVVAVPPIVTQELWQRAREQLTANRKTQLRRTKHLYLLEGLARCGACGGRIMISAGCTEKKGRWSVVRPSRYVCERRKYRRVGPDRCTAPFLEVGDVDARAWALVVRELLDPGLAGELVADRADRAADQQDHQQDVDGYRKHLARLDQVVEKHRDRYRRGVLTDDDFDREMAAINRERAVVRSQLAHAVRAHGSTLTAQARLTLATTRLEAVRARLETAPPAERREIVLTLVDPGGVVFHGERLHVELFVERPAIAVESQRSLGAAGS